MCVHSGCHAAPPCGGLAISASILVDQGVSIFLSPAVVRPSILDHRRCEHVALGTDLLASGHCSPGAERCRVEIVVRLQVHPNVLADATLSGTILYFGVNQKHN